MRKTDDGDSTQQTWLTDEIPEWLKDRLSDEELNALRNWEGWTKGVVRFYDENGSGGQTTKVWIQKRPANPDGDDVYGHDDTGLDKVFAFNSLDELEASDDVNSGWVFVTRGRDSW